MEERNWNVPFLHAHYGSIILTSRLYMDKNGFGNRPSVYPVTIVQSRYSGSYEPGQWLCFPVEPDQLDDAVWRDWNGSDIECHEFWCRVLHEAWPVGYGLNPSEAYTSLLEKVCAMAGVTMEDLTSPPVWPAPRNGSHDRIPPATELVPAPGIGPGTFRSGGGRSIP